MGRQGTGVELREKSIRIGFKFAGEWCRETLNTPPTPANEKRAIKLVETIRRHIAAGTFDYAEFFPDSPRAQQKPAAEVRTFGQVCKLYLQSVGQLEVATVDQYTNAINNVWQPLIGEATPFDTITHDFLAAKIGSHPWASPKSCNNYLIPLRGLFGLMYRGPQAAHNPTVGIKNARVVKKKPDPLTVAERDRILADMLERYDRRVWAYFAFAFYTGMRPEEIIALRWGDVDWNAGLVRIQRVRTFRGSEREGSKTHAERDVDLNQPAIEALQAMKAYTFLKRDKAGEEVDLFENPVTAAPWHDERSQRDHYWKPTLRRLGIRARRPYATRHTYATASLQGEVNPSYVAAQLGHANTKMLFENYARWIPGADGGAARDRMRATFAAKPAEPMRKAANG